MLYVCLPSVFLTEMRWALCLLLYLLPLEQCLGQQRRSVKAFITFLLRHLCRKPSRGHTWGQGTTVGFFPVPGSQCPIYTGSVLWESPWLKDGPFRCHFFENGSSFGAVCPHPALGEWQPLSSLRGSRLLLALDLVSPMVPPVHRALWGIPEGPLGFRGWPGVDHNSS